MDKHNRTVENDSNWINLYLTSIYHLYHTTSTDSWSNWSKFNFACNWYAFQNFIIRMLSAVQQCDACVWVFISLVCCFFFLFFFFVFSARLVNVSYSTDDKFMTYGICIQNVSCPNLCCKNVRVPHSTCQLIRNKNNSINFINETKNSFVVKPISNA